MIDIKEIFASFIAQYDFMKVDARWNEQSKQFREFWKLRILDVTSKASEADYDPIVRLLDIKAKGFNSKTDEAVALTYIRQGVWYRTFNDLRGRPDIRTLLDQIFRGQEESVLIKLLNELQNANRPNKNGLTGTNANVLNAFLFVYNPLRYISSVSLNHRRQIIESLGLANFDTFKTYGEQIVLSNKLILDYFSKSLEGSWSPRTLSGLLYYPPFQSQWLSKNDGAKEDAAGPEEAQVDRQQSEFVLEKHLEDFLVANWESSSLGQMYDLIEDKEEIVSQQYPTDIGKIDLLVRSKQNGEYTVIELKKGQTNDDTVGQLARYMGWVKKNLANEGTVHGIIVAGATDIRLNYALTIVPNSKLLLYRINFNLEEG